MLLLQIQRAGQRDVAVKMPLVKFIEDEGGNAAQLRVVNHLPQQHAFGDEADFRFRRRDVLEADLVADFVAKFDAEFLRHARGEQARGQPARLENRPPARRRAGRASTASAAPAWICRSRWARTKSTAGRLLTER